jgi:hypothetical protein
MPDKPFSKLGLPAQRAAALMVPKAPSGLAPNNNEQPSDASARYVEAASVRFYETSVCTTVALIFAGLFAARADPDLDRKRCCSICWARNRQRSARWSAKRDPTA